MQLIVWQVGSGDTVAQQYTATKNQSIDYLVPHLMVRGAPGGSVYLQLQDSDGNKIADTESVSIATIADGNEIFHGKYRFSITATVRKGVTYRVEMLTSGGYSYGVDDFVGWCNAWERKNVFDQSYNPSWGVNAPLILDIWGREFLKKGDF